MKNANLGFILSASLLLAACDNDDSQAPSFASEWQGTWSEDARPSDAFLVIDAQSVLSVERTVLPDTSVCYRQQELSDLVVDENVFHTRQIIEALDNDARTELADITGVIRNDADFPIELTRITLIAAGADATAIRVAPSAYLVFDDYFTEEDVSLTVDYSASSLQVGDFLPLCD